MKCKIDGQPIDSKFLAPPPMNYGQMWRYDGLKKVSYEYSMSLEEFIEKASYWFELFRQEAIEDSAIDAKGTFPLQDKYGENDFPALGEMIANQRELLAEIVLFFDLDILNEFTSKVLAEKASDIYSINSLDWIKVEKTISFGGIAFQKED